MLDVRRLVPILPEAVSAGETCFHIVHSSLAAKAKHGGRLEVGVAVLNQIVKHDGGDRVDLQISQKVQRRDHQPSVLISELGNQSVQFPHHRAPG